MRNINRANGCFGTQRIQYAIWYDIDVAR